MKAKQKKPRASNATVNVRVEALAHVILDGAVWPLDLIEYVRNCETDKESVWYVRRGEKPLSRPQLYRYVQRAEALIAESCLTSRKRLLKLHLAQRRKLFARAVSQGDVRTALAVKDSEAKLLALFPNPEDALRREVEALKAKLEEIEHGDGNPSSGTGTHTGADRKVSGPDPAAAGKAAL